VENNKNNGYEVRRCFAFYCQTKLTPNQLVDTFRNAIVYRLIADLIKRRKKTLVLGIEAYQHLR
jgi:hypothetical protein